MPDAIYQRSGPFAKLPPKMGVPLALEAIHPVIRIAHRPAGPLHIPERIIFDYEFVLFPYGRGTVRLADQAHTFGPHSLFLIPPFTPHLIESDDATPCEHLAVHFDFAPNVPAFPESLSHRKPYEILMPGGLTIPIKTQLERADLIRHNFDRLVRARAASTALANLEAIGHLIEIITALLAAPARPQETIDPVNRAKLERAVAFIHQHLSDKVSTDTLAQEAGLSRAHFNRLFQAWTGYPPMEYLRRHRVQVARKLLANVDLSIKEVAQQAGFADAFSFSKTFRKIDGLPPTEYRRALLAGR